MTAALKALLVIGLHVAEIVLLLAVLTIPTVIVVMAVQLAVESIAIGRPRLPRRGA